MARVPFEVGYTFPRGRQPQFAPYGQFNPVGFTGYAPLWIQPGRYPVSDMGKLQQTALDRENEISIMTASRHPGLADPGLNNEQSLSQPLDNAPAVQAQQIALRGRAAALPTVQSLASMNMGLGLK